VKTRANVAANERHFVNATSKTAISMVLLIVLAGCEDKAEKKKVEALELKVSHLESMVSNHNNRTMDILSNMNSVSLRIAGMAFTNSQAIANVDAKYERLWADVVTNELTVLGDIAKSLETNQPTKSSTTPQPRRTAVPAMKEGIPLEIYNQIAAEAAKDWPGDYRMQVSRIEHEVEAYKKLHQ